MQYWKNYTIGFFSFLPLLHALILIFIIFPLYAYRIIYVYNSNYKYIENELNILLYINIGMSIVLFLLAIFYTVLIIRNDNVKISEKIAWIILLCFFGVFIMPAYWYRYIRTKV